ncbi:MAG: DUF4139 domain-containing protein [Desulfobacteraceae bacterium]|nr:DUF4139 domain-containing protein [Desulfobacteraceae bacterium]
MKRFICLVMLVHLLTTPCHARPGEIDTGAMDQTSLFVTIYNQDMALVKEKRAVTLPKGESTLAFRDVSGKIIPETALLKSEGLRVVEQNFEFDLLSPESLLEKFTGKSVELIKTHPETGQETRMDAKVLATHNGVVLETPTGIETGIPGRLLFPHIPANLRTSPTLTMTVQSNGEKSKSLELSYLTQGLTWRADYVAELNPNDDRLNLKAWVTLTNTSRTDYTDAVLQLVAGDIHLAPRERRPRAMPMVMEARAKGSFAREEMFEYHLYTLERKTTLKNNQTKQVALLQAKEIPCAKEYLIDGQSHYFSRSMGPGVQTPKVRVLLHFQNTKENNLGMPLPKGVIRVYKQDSRGMLQFAGEDRMDHTPDKGKLALTLGNAFDITAEKKQTDFRKLSGSGRDAYRYQSSYEIKIANAKTSPVTVTVSEPVPGDWRITRQSHPHTKASSNRAQWRISVPARGETTLSYTVQTK